MWFVVTIGSFRFCAFVGVLSCCFVHYSPGETNREIVALATEINGFVKGWAVEDLQVYVEAVKEIYTGSFAEGENLLESRHLPPDKKHISLWSPYFQWLALLRFCAEFGSTDGLDKKIAQKILFDVPSEGKGADGLVSVQVT